MLSKLLIQNYAIIDEIEINFCNALNIITGETGAGKSILMGALNLILGERADTSALLNKDKKCIIEGYFSIAQKTDVKAFLTNNNFEIFDELILRREIASNGKSRAFINDSPATLLLLKQLATLLVDLHQQFDTLELGNTNFQRDVIDALANHSSTIQNYQTIFFQWQQTLKTINDLKEQKNNFNKEADYNKFLYNELEEIHLKENELEDLENELQILSNSEGIKNALNKVHYELKENAETPIITTLKHLAQQLQSFANYHKDLPTLIDRLNSTQIELQDIAQETENLNYHINFDEKRIEAINDKLSVGYKLLKKHGVKTTAELLEIQNELNTKLQSVLEIDDTILAKEKEANLLFHNATTLASTLSITRKKQILFLEETVNSLLFQVGMPNASIKINIEETELNYYGKDNIEFLFDANKSNRYEKINKVASGGELSRLMLCIKSLVAESIDLPTLIFDEIDTGISGEAAKQVGNIMQQLACKRQIICITHQPQIAGKANAHFYVYKEIKNDVVKTNIKLLNNDERIINIAKMLSGEKPSTAAIESAKEMMN
ncbi:MAG: DNA repair protein RecN [Chitinophagaceae bacterium]|nr:DNA repair protein RecN [Chitinophagaceae bacterium]